MLARGELDIEADLASDTAPLHGLVAALLDATTGRALPARRHPRRGRDDPQRGGPRLDVAVVVDEDAIPVRPEVRGACEILGIDPLYVACEGRLVAVVDGAAADAALAALRAHPLGAEAAVIGRIKRRPARRWSC